MSLLRLSIILFLLFGLLLGSFAQSPEEARKAVRERLEALRAQEAELKKKLKAVDAEAPDAPDAPKATTPDETKDPDAAKTDPAEKPDAKKPGAKVKAVAKARVVVVPGPFAIPEAAPARNARDIPLDGFVLDSNFLADGEKIFLEHDGEGEAEATPDHLLLMKPGNELTGELSKISKDAQTIHWTQDGVEDPIKFNISGVADLKLRPREVERTEHTSAIRLTNKDFLVGDILGMDEDVLTFKTWYGGELQIRRPVVSAINPASGNTMLVYEGPTSEEGWEQAAGRRSWVYEEGAFYARRSGAIGRNFEGMPDKVRIDFTAEWESYPYFTVAFASDDIKSRSSGNNYSLQIQSSRIQLNRSTEDDSSNRVWDLPTSNSRDKTKVTYTVLYDKEEANILFMMNGDLKKEWTDASGFAGKGSGLMFYCQNNNTLKISDVRISQWNGKKPEDTPEEEDIGDEVDVVYFTNGDRMVGNAKAIKNGKLHLDIEFGPVKIDLDRITEITLGKKYMEEARRNKGDVRAEFAEAGIITVKLTGMEGDTMLGSSENFGDIKLPLHAFKKLAFNLYDRSPTKKTESQFGF